MFMEDGKLDYSNIYLSYLLYYLPCNTYKIHRALSDLILNGLLKFKISVFDIGTGPGSIPIGIIDYYIQLAKYNENLKFSVDLTILDAEKKFLDIAESMIFKVKRILPRNLNVNLIGKVNRKIDSNAIFSNKYDIVCMSNLLNMFEVNDNLDKTVLIKNIKGIMENNGSLIIIEPGDDKDCFDFKLLRNSIINNSVLNLYSPCISLWNKKEEYTCNCFSCAKVLWKKPSIIEQLNLNGLSKNKEDVAYSYFIFRKDNKKKYDDKRISSEYTSLKDLKYEDNKRVKVCGLVRCFKEKNNRYYVSICDGSKEMDELSSVWLAINKDDKDVYNKYGDTLKSMNVGQKIVAKNVIFEKAYKYPESLYLLIDNVTILEFYY